MRIPMDNMLLWIARRIPRRLRYWAVIVAAAEATCGKWSDTDASAITMMDVLKRVNPDAV